MEGIQKIVSGLSESYPSCYNAVILKLVTLLSTTPPPCIYVHAPFSPRPTALLIRTILNIIQAKYAIINGVECLSARLFFDRVLNALVQWNLSWEQNCKTFGSERFHSNLDGFMEGLRTILHNNGDETGRTVIVIERADRFRENLSELFVPLTRLGELSNLNLTVIFLSQASWFELRPLNGFAIDPFLISVANRNKDDSISSLISLYPTRSTPPFNIYSPQLKPLYAQFISALHGVCSYFVADDFELSYLAAACWPGYIYPVLADWRAQNEVNPTFLLPSEEARMRLIRYFTPSFTKALGTVYPRDQHARQWARENAPQVNLRLSEIVAGCTPDTWKGQEGPQQELTTIAKYILVAAFLASFNPAKTDIKLIGRAAAERKKKRGGGTRKTRGGGTAKISQRLLGPQPFPLDRLIAILGTLMEENEEDENSVDVKDTEMTVGRIHVSATISELVALHLLHRTNPADRLDGPLHFKCGISQTRAFQLARELGIGTLAEFLWDPN